MHNSRPEPLLRVGHRVYERRDELLDRATEQILATIPAYKRLVPHDDLLESGRNVLGIVLDALLTPDQPAGAPATQAVTAAVDAGRRRHRQGVALEDVLRAIRLDFSVLWDALTAEAEAEPDPSATVSLGALRIWKALDEAMLHITEGYRREEAAQDRARAVRRHRAMAELIDERDPSAHTVTRIAEALEFDERARFLVVVGRLSDEAAYRLDTHWRSLGAPSYAGTHGADVIAVTSWSTAARQIISRAARGHLVVVAPPVSGLRRVPGAVRLARAAVHGTANDRTGILDARDLLIEALAAAAPDIAATLADEILAPLNATPAGERAKLLETMRAWAETDGTTSAVARRLYRHRNTVTNHLRRIQELTGLSLTRPADVATLVVALRSQVATR